MKFRLLFAFFVVVFFKLRYDSIKCFKLGEPVKVNKTYLDDSWALHTDLYQINMMKTYWELGKADNHAVFECYFRNNPFENGYAIFAGLERIVDYIEKLKFTAKSQGHTSLTLRSGDLQKEMGLTKRLPMVCNAMYQCMLDGDKILHTTPSGKSSTIEIQYFL